MIKILMHLIKADLTLFFRAKLALFWTLAFPLLMLVMQMGLFNHEVKLGPFTLAIIDHDHSIHSQEYRNYIISNLRLQKTIIFKEINLNKENNNNVDVIIEIPNNFSSNIRAQSTSNLKIRGRLTAGTEQDAVYGLLRGLSDGYNLSGLNNPPKVSLISDLNKIKKINYGLYLVTGLAGMIILSTALIGFAGPIVAAREGGMFRIYQLFPIDTALVVVAWWISRLIIIWFATLLIFAIAWLIYGIDISFDMTSLVTALFILSLGTGAFLSLGFLIAALTNSVAATTMVCNLFYFPLLFTGNLMIPINSLPSWMSNIVNRMPINSMMQSLRRCLSGEFNWRSEYYTVTVLILMTVVCLSLSIRRFTWVPRT